MRMDPNGNVAPDKEKATDRIDGMVALIMAWGRAILDRGLIRSVYDGLTVEQMMERMAIPDIEGE